MNRVFFKAWRVNVGRVPVYLLDTNHPGQRPAFPRSDCARLWRRQHHARDAGNSAGHRRRPPVAQARNPTVGLSHERRPRGVSHAGIDPRKNGCRPKPGRCHCRHPGAMHFHHPHAGRGRPRPVQPGIDGLRLPALPAATAHPLSRAAGTGPRESEEPGGTVLHDGAGAQGFARRQRRERTARPGQPPHVAGPLSRSRRRTRCPSAISPTAFTCSAG